MLTIRKPQMDALMDLPRTLFEDKLISQIYRFYPRECGELGREQTRVVVQKGIERAEEHDLYTERQIGIYVSIVFLLGSDFDRDPQLQRVTEPLDDHLSLTRSERAIQLWDSVMHYIDETAGKDNQFLIRALIRIRDYPREALPPFSDDFETDIYELFRRLYPQKCAYQGESATRELIRSGQQTAARYGLQTSESVGIFLVMAYILGSGFHRDPLYPWASNIFKHSALDERARADALYTAAQAYLKAALAME